MSFWKNIKGRFLQRDVVMRIIIVNILVFLFINIYLLVIGRTDVYGEFALVVPSNWNELLHRPWSVITYMFSHEDPGHILFNMLTFYFMGGILTGLTGRKSILPLYIMGGLAGWLLFALSYNYLPRYAADGNTFMLGASAAVMATTIAAATYAPRMQLNLFGVFRIELRWLALLLLALDLVSIRRGINSGGHISHVGGAMLGYFYASQYKSGTNMFGWLERFISWIGSLFGGRTRMKVTVNHARPKSDEQFNVEKKTTQERVDRILDKISRSGYESLSKDEKDFLFRHSQK